MKAITTFALLAVGAVLIDITPLQAGETNSSTETAFKQPLSFPPQLGYGATQAGVITNVPGGAPEGLPFRDKVTAQFVPPGRPEADARPGEVYRPKVELRPTSPNNVVQSERYRYLDYSGILVQAVRNNPLQLINPFAPAEYGDGEANTVRSVITGQAVGLKVLGIHF